MLKLPRKLLLWGGAAVVVASGSAFMASNTVAQSSAGEGTGPVLGYTVSNISYGVPYGANTNLDNVYYTGHDYAAAKGVYFTLTSDASSSPADGQPVNVDAYPLNKAGNIHWGHDNGCSIQGTWTINGGVGSGNYFCAFSPEVPIGDIGSLAIEANQ